MADDSIENICANDDLEGIAKYISVGQAVNDLHQVSAFDEPVSAAWLAAFFSSRKVIAFLVARGGDVEFQANSLSVRHLGMANSEALRGMIEGGMKPNGVELAKLILTKRSSNEIPTSRLVGIACDLLDENESILEETSDKYLGELFSQHRTVEILGDDFDYLVADDVLYKKDKIYRSDLKKFRRNFLNAMQGLLARSASYAIENFDVIDQIICRRFSGYRKDRRWLTERASRACDDICAVLAPSLDLFEDDPELRAHAEFLVARYPVKERLAGLALEPAPRLSGQALEFEVAQSLAEAGFEVERVGATGDQGADVIARRDGLCFAIQCKDHGKPVGNASVQQALSAKAYYKSDYAVVCASNGFTKSAKALAAPANVLLIPPHMMPELMSLRFMVE